MTEAKDANYDQLASLMEGGKLRGSKFDAYFKSVEGIVGGQPKRQGGLLQSVAEKYIAALEEKNRIIMSDDAKRAFRARLHGIGETSVTANSFACALEEAARTDGIYNLASFLEQRSGSEQQKRAAEDYRLQVVAKAEEALREANKNPPVLPEPQPEISKPKNMQTAEIDVKDGEGVPLDPERSPAAVSLKKLPPPDDKFYYLAVYSKKHGRVDMYAVAGVQGKVQGKRGMQDKRGMQGKKDDELIMPDIKGFRAIDEKKGVYDIVDKNNEKITAYELGALNVKIDANGKPQLHMRQSKITDYSDIKARVIAAAITGDENANIPFPGAPPARTAAVRLSFGQ